MRSGGRFAYETCVVVAAGPRDVQVHFRDQPLVVDFGEFPSVRVALVKISVQVRSRMCAGGNEVRSSRCLALGSHRDLNTAVQMIGDLEGRQSSMSTFGKPVPTCVIGERHRDASLFGETFLPGRPLLAVDRSGAADRQLSDLVLVDQVLQLCAVGGEHCALLDIRLVDPVIQGIAKV
nr:hypothetical protein [Rhodococcus sp. WWJCD1]